MTFENLLLPWQELWSKEPLDFPDLVYPPEVEELVEKMIPLKLEELENFLRLEVLKIIPAWDEIQQATWLPPIYEKNFSSPPKQKKMSKKKFHEIEEILNFMFRENCVPNHLFDCAGGAGLFTQEFFQKTTNFNPRPIATLIDKNARLLEMSAHLSKERLTIIHDNFFNLSLESLSEAKKNVGPHFWLGLHACGGLTDFLIEQFPLENHLCSIGCCYHMLPTNWGKQHPININLPLTNEALTLAAKGTQFLDLTSLIHRFKVKSYRYPFELGLRKIYDYKGSVNLRSFPSRIYQGSYGEYLEAAMDRFPHVKKSNFAATMIEFREEPKVQQLITRLILLGLLRHFFSRPLEIYISYHRLLKLARRLNRPVRDLAEIFHRSLSPRNVLITSFFK